MKLAQEVNDLCSEGAKITMDIVNKLADLRGSKIGKVKLRVKKPLKGVVINFLGVTKVTDISPGIFDFGGGNIDIEDILLGNIKDDKGGKGSKFIKSAGKLGPTLFKSDDGDVHISMKDFIDSVELEKGIKIPKQVSSDNLKKGQSVVTPDGKGKISGIDGDEITVKLKSGKTMSYDISEIDV